MCSCVLCVPCSCLCPDRGSPALWYGRSAVPRSRGRLASSGSVGVGRTVRSLFAAAVLSRRLACSPPLRFGAVKGVLPVRPFLSRPCAFCTFLPAKDRSQALGSNPRRRCPALWCRPPDMPSSEILRPTLPTVPPPSGVSIRLFRFNRPPQENLLSPPPRSSPSTAPRGPAALALVMAPRRRARVGSPTAPWAHFA